MVLRKASVPEKQSILGFDFQLAQAVFNAYNTRNIRDFSDLERALSPNQINTIIGTFLALTQEQLDYFNRK